MFYDVTNLTQAKGSVMNDSHILYTSDQIAYVVSLIPDFKPSTRLSLVYRASRDGWGVKDFHAKSDGKGTTITLIKCKTGRVCGGFTRVPWSSPSFTGCFKYDP
jgi:hypothetical protein